MLSGLFANTLYVRVRKNQFHVRDVDSGEELTFLAEVPFTTVRMLIGDFTAADAALKRAVAQIRKAVSFKVGLRIVIHPLEMLEGGLSEIENRILHEVALGTGARSVPVWVGPELSDADAKAKF